LSPSARIDSTRGRFSDSLRAVALVDFALMAKCEVRGGHRIGLLECLESGLVIRCARVGGRRRDAGSRSACGRRDCRFAGLWIDISVRRVASTVLASSAVFSSAAFVSADLSASAFALRATPAAFAASALSKPASFSAFAAAFVASRSRRPFSQFGSTASSAAAFGAGSGTLAGSTFGAWTDVGTAAAGAAAGS
jgi:hypothetical protein